MFDRSDVERVREGIEQHIGARVKIAVRKGRKRIIVRYGVLKAVYPFTFNITMDAASAFAEAPRNVSLNYSDILTGVLTITIEETGEEIK